MRGRPKCLDLPSSNNAEIDILAAERVVRAADVQNGVALRVEADNGSATVMPPTTLEAHRQQSTPRPRARGLCISTPRRPLDANSSAPPSAPSICSAPVPVNWLRGARALRGHRGPHRRPSEPPHKPKDRVAGQPARPPRHPNQRRATVCKGRRGLCCIEPEAHCPSNGRSGG